MDCICKSKAGHSMNANATCAVNNEATEITASNIKCRKTEHAKRYFPFFFKITSISSITLFMDAIVFSKGSEVVMSTPAFFSNSIG